MDASQREAAGAQPGRASFRLEIFLVSLAAIVLEISYTRIFSFKLYYYFTYLILGIALLGLGSGGILVSLSQRLRRVAPERVVAAGTLGAAAAEEAADVVEDRAVVVAVEGAGQGAGAVRRRRVARHRAHQHRDGAGDGLVGRRLVEAELLTDLAGAAAAEGLGQEIKNGI